MKHKFFILSILIFATALFGQTQNRLKDGSSALKSKNVNAELLLKDVEILSADNMQGRAAGSEGGRKAREYVLKRFRESGIQPFGKDYVQEFPLKLRGQTETAEGANVVGFIKGKKQPEKYIVVTAHYDHVGTRGGEVYNGADDNASGTSALFALAEYFKKNRPAHSLIFVAFDAEEMGLQGSKYFVANLPVKKESILVNLNMDMIAHNDVNELYAVGTYAYPSLKPALEKVAKEAKVRLLFGHEGPNVSKQDDWTNQSDQGSFNKEKIPFIYFGVEDHKDYHKPTDDFVNINQAFYVRAVETVLASLKAFDANFSKIGK